MINVIINALTVDGPPSSRGVLKVVAMLEQRPCSDLRIGSVYYAMQEPTMILNAKLICIDMSPVVALWDMNYAP